MTNDILPQFKVQMEPVADPKSVVLTGNARFTVITSRLIRMEYDPAGRFEDRASQSFWFRKQPVPQYAVQRDADRLEIDTEHLHLTYHATPEGFTSATVSVLVKETGQVWQKQPLDWLNLGGTYRTLDGRDGPVELEPGLVSRSGWAVVDDTPRLVFNAEGWLEPRHPAADYADLYFFGYGHDYTACLVDFNKVSGQTPLIPRWILGNWWSRYWEFSQAELKELMEDFRRREFPLSVCIIDMDWHITDTGNQSTGWTGYTWNRKLWPDPYAFIAWLHEQGLHTALNLHPAEGIHPHEEVYPQMAQYMGQDPSSKEPVAFDIANPHFMRGYFELVHHPMEDDGVDFWWMDWQQGSASGMKGLDPLYMLNHLHFYDLGRDGKKRPFVFSRWSCLGNHRYPIGFSGDSVVSWASLAFQPYFTATASNVAFGWWSHDIGGHMSGMEEPELYTRWVQFGVFSPIFRLHCTKNPYQDRRPWVWNGEVTEVTRKALQLRHALIPYLYSMAWRNHTQSIPLILPMYYEYPEHGEAYRCREQYRFGSELIAAPFISPREKDTRLSTHIIWLPEGGWFDFFTGRYYPGGKHYPLYGGLDEIPVFARAGAIVPMGPLSGWGGIDNPEHLYVTVFPGADNRFELYEDDGESEAYRDGKHCTTVFRQEWRGESLTFKIEPLHGEKTDIPAGRDYRLVFRGVKQPALVKMTAGGKDLQVNFVYDADLETLSFDPFRLAPDQGLELVLEADSGSLIGGRDRRPDAVRKLLRAFNANPLVKLEIDQRLPDLLADPSELATAGSRGPFWLPALDNPLTEGQYAALLKTIEWGPAGS